MLRKYRIQLDICTICNLNCPACSMRHLNYGELKAGYLKADTFKSFIIKNKDYIKNIEISNSGEPFLNPEAIDILKYAYEYNVTLTCKNASNFNFKNDDLLKAMVTYHLDDVSVAIDGASQEVYSQYRVNGNFDLVIDNIRKLQKYKKELNSEYPKITWQYIIRESTEDPKEIKKAIKMAEDLGINIFFKLTWEKNYKPNPEWEEEIKSLTNLPWLTRQDLNKSSVDVARSDLKYAHNSNKCTCLVEDKKIVFNWDGRWLGCCANKIPSELNVFEIGIKGLIKSDEYLNTKYYLTDDDRYNPDLPCFCKYCLTKLNN